MIVSLVSGITLVHIDDGWKHDRRRNVDGTVNKRAPENLEILQLHVEEHKGIMNACQKDSK